MDDNAQGAGSGDVVIGGGAARLILGDCLERLKGLADNSVDSVVTDPPYGLSFMGKKWDYDVPSVEVWAEALRVLKPGGYLLAFAGTRTQHRMACRIEDAGFEIRDMIAWVYGSGFPKHKSALKPALEPITMARKPAKRSTLLNVDACRVASTDSQLAEKYASVQKSGARANSIYGTDSRDRAGAAPHDAGRYPANLIHDGSAEVVAMFPQSDSKGGGGKPKSGYWGNAGEGKDAKHGDAGSAARFFYCAKASRRDRNEGVGGSDDPAVAFGSSMSEKENADWAKRNGNHHPTVKPTDLMRYLVRLVTPPGGVCLDPFTGSGSTGKAAMLEGFRFIGCELGTEYLAIAAARIRHAHGLANPDPVPVEPEPQLSLFG